MKTKLIHKMSREPGGGVGRFIRIYCDCDTVYEHPAGEGCDLPWQCHPEKFAESRGERLDA